MRYMLLVVAVLVAGCAKDGGWYKNGASEQEFMQSRGRCVAQAYAGPPMSRAVIMAGCMQGEGWTWKEN